MVCRYGTTPPSWSGQDRVRCGTHSVRFDLRPGSRARSIEPWSMVFLSRRPPPPRGVGICWCPPGPESSIASSHAATRIAELPWLCWGKSTVSVSLYKYWWTVKCWRIEWFCLILLFPFLNILGEGWRCKYSDEVSYRFHIYFWGKKYWTLEVTHKLSSLLCLLHLFSCFICIYCSDWNL